jgi:hypothetical protein
MLDTSPKTVVAGTMRERGGGEGEVEIKRGREGDRER